MRIWQGVIIVFLLLITVLPVQAATPSGITLEPAFQELVLENQEQEISFSITLTNHTAEAVTLNLSTADFGSLDVSGGVAFLGDPGNAAGQYRLAEWMTLEQATVLLPAQGTQTVVARIQNSDTLAPGGHYGAVLFETVLPNTPSSEENPVAIHQRFSALIFLKKTGGEIYGLALQGVAKPDTGIWLPKSVVLRFRNTGNVHVIPRGLVTITDPFGRQVAKGIINEETALTLPETERDYTVTLKNALPWLPGMYRLTVAERYDSQMDFRYMETRFFLFPLATIVGIFIVLGGVWSYYFWRVKRKQKKQSFPIDTHS